MSNEPDPDAPNLRHVDPTDGDAYAIVGAPSSPRANHGPAGSLRQQLARHQALTPRTWTSIAIVPYMLTVLLLTGASMVLALTVSLIWFYIGALIALVGYGPLGWLKMTGRDVIVFDDAGNRLRRQIRSETKAAKVLSQLIGDGWHILPDRLLPDTGHRLPFLLVGPAGVIIVNVIPDSEPLRLDENGNLHAGHHNLGSWVDTRHWEIARTVQGLTAIDAGDVTVWAVALHDPIKEPFKPKVPTGHHIAGRMLVVIDIDYAATWVRDHGSPLPREYVALLAGNVEAAFPSAAEKDQTHDH